MAIYMHLTRSHCLLHRRREGEIFVRAGGHFSLSAAAALQSFAMLLRSHSLISNLPALPLRFTPILPVSCVQPDGLTLLTVFLANLAPPPVPHWQLSSASTEFWIDQVYKRIAEAEGPVLQGYLESGSIDEGQELLLGPTESGAFVPVRVLSLHRNRLPCRRVRSGQTVSVAVAPSDLVDESGEAIRRR